MITKTVEPIIEKGSSMTGCNVVGTKVEYRLLGILLYKKVLYTPNKNGMHFEGEFFTRF